MTSGRPTRAIGRRRYLAAAGGFAAAPLLVGGATAAPISPRPGGVVAGGPAGRRMLGMLVAGSALALALGSAAAAQTPLPPGRVAPESMRTIAPALADYTDRVLFGEVWRRPGLASRDRSLVTVASLIAGGRAAQLTSHLGRGLDNGLRPAEVSGLITHLAFYAGWPNAVSAIGVAEEVFKRRGIDPAALSAASAAARPVAAAESAPSKRVSEQMTAVAPALAHYTDAVLFDDLWRRSDLSPRDRSLATIAALVTNGDADQLAFHLDRGLRNGLTREELGEVVIHLAFYAGWPKATGAVRVMTRAFADARATPAAPAPGAALRVVRAGTDPTAAPASHFTGSARVDTSLRADAPSRVAVARVSFERGARTHWHSHPLGQTLIVTAGHGLIQVEGEPVRAIGPGDVVWTAPGVKHWHGTTPESTMTHYGVSERVEDENVTWLGAVSEAEYGANRVQR